MVGGVVRPVPMKELISGTPNILRLRGFSVDNLLPQKTQSTNAIRETVSPWNKMDLSLSVSMEGVYIYI